MFLPSKRTTFPLLSLGEEQPSGATRNKKSHVFICPLLEDEIACNLLNRLIKRALDVVVKSPLRVEKKVKITSGRSAVQVRHGENPPLRPSLSERKRRPLGYLASSASMAWSPACSEFLISLLSNLQPASGPSGCMAHSWRALDRPEVACDHPGTVRSLVPCSKSCLSSNSLGCAMPSRELSFEPNTAHRRAK